MIPNIFLEEIKIFSNILGKEKQIFEWKFNKINILFSENNSGKTTLFHILKDILGNHNVAGNNSEGKNILTEDMIIKGIEVSLVFKINDNKFHVKKSYTNQGGYKFYNDNDFIGPIQSFYKYIYDHKIVELPKVQYGGKQRITLNSLMRFSFIEQAHFGKNFRVKDHKSTNIIIKHNNDGFSKIILYLYIFNIINNDDTLTEMYANTYLYSSKKKELRSIQKQINLLDTTNTFDTEGGIFDDVLLLKTIKELEKRKRNKALSNFNYNDILSKFYEIYSINSRENNIKNDNFLYLLQKDIKFIEDRIAKNKDQIMNINIEIQKNRESLKEIDNMLGLHFIDILNTIDGDDNKNLFKSLLKNKEILKKQSQELEEIYNNYIELLLSSDVVKFFKKFIIDHICFLDPEKLGLEIDFLEGKYSINTTSDSINRIALFNILNSFIFLKEKLQLNHPGFVVYDSPFAGVDKTKEIQAINNFIENFNTYLPNGQFFIFLNPDEIKMEELSLDFEFIGIKQGAKKLFTF